MNITDALTNLNDEQCDALLAEIGDKNRVRVVKYQAVEARGFRRIYKRVMDEEFRTKLFAPALVHLDEKRIMAGLKPRFLPELLRLMGGELVSVTANIRTTVGIDYITDSLAKSASRPAVAEFMALSENVTAPATSDTALASEITTGGLARAQATYAHTSGATIYTLQKTFTASSTFTVVQKEAVFNAAGPPPAGTIFIENTFTPTALSVADQLTVTHSVNV